MTGLARGIRNGIALALPCWLLAASCSLLHGQIPTRTTPFTDTVTAGDTTRIISGTVSVGVAVNISSVAVQVRPRTDTVIVLPSVATRGIGVGPFNGTPGSTGTLFINANNPADLAAQLSAASGHCIFAAPAGGSHSKYMTNGKWDYFKWKAVIDFYADRRETWRAAAMSGKLCGVTIIDEPQAGETWGGSAIPWALVSKAACYAATIFPNVAIYTRTDATTIPVGTACLRGAMLQYSVSKGSVTTWASSQVAAAKAKGLVLTAGVNAENGGKVVAGCYPSSTRPGKCRMSGAELTTYLTTLARDSSVVCGMTLWVGNADQWANYTAKADVRTALTALAAWGRTRSRPARCGG